LSLVVMVWTTPWIAVVCGCWSAESMWRWAALDPVWATEFEIVKGSQDLDFIEKSYQGSWAGDSNELFFRRFVCGFGGRCGGWVGC